MTVWKNVRISTLIAVHAVAAVMIWANVGEAVLGRNEFIMPFGWPNEGVYFYQESYHEVRSQRGLAPMWGHVAVNGLAGDAILFGTIVIGLYLFLERDRLGLHLPQRNTVWILAGVLAVLLAANICKRPDSFLDDNPGFGAGYGLPFIGYSLERFFAGALSSDAIEYMSPYVTHQGWNLANIVTNMAVIGWILFWVYMVCERAIFRAKTERPVTVAQELREGV